MARRYSRHWQQWLMGPACALFILGFLLVGCRAAAEGATATSNAQVTLTTSPKPPIVGLAHLDVALRSAGGNPIDGATLQVRGDMAGMQPILVDLKRSGNGHYATSSFRFTMAGDWILTVNGTLPSGARVLKEFQIDRVRDR